MEQQDTNQDDTSVGVMKKHPIESDETARQRIEQVQALKEQVQTGGLEFEAYLPPSLAEWVLDMVEKGIFFDPSEAVFVLMGQAKEIEPHDDLKHEILKRRIEQGLKSAEEGRVYSIEEVWEGLAKLHEEQTEPAVWREIKQEV